MPHTHARILLVLTLLGVLLAGACGWFFGTQMNVVAWIGTLFLNTLKMLIVPLVLAAVISGVAGLGSTAGLGRIGGVSVFYYTCTTAIAVFIGMVVVNMIQPGLGLAFSLPETAIDFAEKQTGLSEIALSLISPNIVAAAAQGKILPLIVFAIFFGAGLLAVGKPAAPVRAFFESVNDVMLQLVTWVMYTAPLGIFALVAARLGQAGGGDAFFAQIQAVGLYVVSVVSGLAVHAIVLGFILWFFGKRGWPYIVGMARALAIAFGTASSSATLPTTIECAKEQKISPTARRFVLPLGSTINMDGTALYEAVAVMFIAQAYGFDLTISQQAIVFITATLAAIGAAGIPEAGLVMMVIVLNAVGLPLEGIGLLLAVDWFLDRCRTTVNVWGDSVGAAVVDRALNSKKGQK